MVPFYNDLNTSGRYESLARFAFNNCRKKGDPWWYAGEIVGDIFVLHPLDYAKKALSTILKILIWGYRDSDFLDELIILEKNSCEAKSHGEIIGILDRANEVIRDIKN